MINEGSASRAAKLRSTELNGNSRRIEFYVPRFASPRQHRFIRAFPSLRLAAGLRTQHYTLGHSITAMILVNSDPAIRTSYDMILLILFARGKHVRIRHKTYGRCSDFADSPITEDSQASCRRCA